MSKENNLTDYLEDLYQGIASKKPGASKNPQDFRAEIESITTGTSGTLPPEVTSEEDANALAIGSVFTYKGTTGTFENGVMYLVEEGG
jgi:hypothetical protein